MVPDPKNDRSSECACTTTMTGPVGALIGSGIVIGWRSVGAVYGCAGAGHAGRLPIGVPCRSTWTGCGLDASPAVPVGSCFQMVTGDPPVRAEAVDAKSGCIVLLSVITVTCTW